MVTEPISADSAISIAWALITSTPDTAETSLERARTLLNYASVLHQAEGLAGARASEARAQEQLELQRKMAGPLDAMADLVDDIAETEDGKWNAGMVNHWIRTARDLAELAARS